MRVVFPSYFLGRVQTRARLLVAGALLSGLPLTVSAQTPPIDGNALGKMLMGNLTKNLSDMESKKVHVSPKIVIVDSVNKTATLEFANNSKDTLRAALSISSKVPSGGSPFGGGQQASTKKTSAKASALLAEEADSGDKASEADSTKSLAGWIKELPAEITLAPGEKKTITVKLDVPADAEKGEYAAWIVTTVNVSGSLFSGGGVKTQDGTDTIAMPVISTGKVVYRIPSQ